MAPDSVLPTSSSVTIRKIIALLATVRPVEFIKTMIDVLFYNLIPRKLMKAIPIRPVIINVMPMPRNGFGTLL